jgi:hypothetical protein
MDGAALQVQEQDLAGFEAAAGGIEVYGIGSKQDLRSNLFCFFWFSCVAFSFLKSSEEFFIRQVEVSRKAISLSWI